MQFYKRKLSPKMSIDMDFKWSSIIHVVNIPVYSTNYVNNRHKLYEHFAKTTSKLDEKLNHSNFGNLHFPVSFGQVYLGNH
jgi:hypothetical protein